MSTIYNGILSPLRRMFAGRRFIPVVIGSLISLLLIACALYMSTFAGRSSLPTPLPVQAPLVPQVVSIVPAPALFLPPAPPAPGPAEAVSSGPAAVGAVVNSTVPQAATVVASPSGGSNGVAQSAQTAGFSGSSSGSGPSNRSSSEDDNGRDAGRNDSRDDHS